MQQGMDAGTLSGSNWSPSGDIAIGNAKTIPVDGSWRVVSCMDTRSAIHATSGINVTGVLDANEYR